MKIGKFEIKMKILDLTSSDCHMNVNILVVKSLDLDPLFRNIDYNQSLKKIIMLRRTTTTK